MGTNKHTVLCLECFSENNISYKECWRCHRGPLNPNPERASNGLILVDWNIFWGFVGGLDGISIGGGKPLCHPLSPECLVKFDGFHYDCTCGARLVFNPRDHIYDAVSDLLWQLPEGKIAFPCSHSIGGKGCGMICVKPTGFGIWKGFDAVFGCKRPEEITVQSSGNTSLN